jgi:hypothetical protein
MNEVISGTQTAARNDCGIQDAKQNEGVSLLLF